MLSWARPEALEMSWLISFSAASKLSGLVTTCGLPELDATAASDPQQGAKRAPFLTPRQRHLLTEIQRLWEISQARFQAMVQCL